MISPTYGLGKKIKNTLQHYAGRAMAICLITIMIAQIVIPLQTSVVQAESNVRKRILG